MSYTWFKLHHDLPGDIKIRMFTPQEKWAWIALLCLSSQGKDRGEIASDNDDIAGYCEFNCTQDWLYFRDKLISKGMLEFGGSGCLKVIHWCDRQHEKPSDRPEAIKKRVSEHRKRKNSANETPCNALHQKSNALVTPQTRLDKTRLDKTRLEEEEEYKYSDLRSISHEPEQKIADAIAVSVEVMQSEISDQENIASVNQTQLAIAEVWMPATLTTGFTAEGFDEFWANTVMKQDKAKSRAEYLKIKNVDAQSVLKKWVAQQKWHIEHKGSTQYLKRPLTWLKGRCWEDWEEGIDPIANTGMDSKTIVKSVEAAQLAKRLHEKYGT